MLALLLGLDPWMLLTVLFALLWVVEMRASQRRWLNGMIHGYNVGFEQAHKPTEPVVAAIRERIMDAARAGVEPR